jgi:AraC-like DNA-binding protein
MFDGNDFFSFVKDVAQQRSYPQIFRIAPDDAIILGSYDPWGVRLDSTVIDRVKGEPFTSPFFHEWRPISVSMSANCDDSFIGDEEKGIYSYLFPVENASGVVAIGRVDGTVFSLLPTTCPVPVMCNQKPISYYSSILVDRQSKRAYLVGTDNIDNKDEGRHYILCIEYGKGEIKGAAPLTLYYTDPMPESASAIPVLTDEGNLLFVGGTPIGSLSDNFRPSPSVILLRFGSAPVFAKNEYLWLWVLLLALAIAAAAAFVFHRWRRPTLKYEPEAVQGNGSAVKKDDELMLRIEHLMDEQQLFLRPGLKVSDVATALDTNSRYVSDCIKAAKGCAFLKFVNGYRIGYAQHLLSQYPEKKISNIATESGFSSDKSFLRTFREFTGTTPAEWRNSPQK